MRWAWIALCALSMGCAKPAADWLEGYEPSFDQGVDAEPDAARPVGPEANLEEMFALESVIEPRGLAWDGAHLWTTDRATDELLELNLEGAVVERWPLPERGARSLTWHQGALYVGFAGGISRFEDGEFEALVALRELAGISTGPEGLISAQPDGLFVRHDENLAPRLELSYSDAVGPLVRYNANYLIYSHSPRLHGERFTPLFVVADALGNSEAQVRGAITVPLDTGRVTGVALDRHRLWLVGAGYGDESYQLAAFTLIPEAQR